MVVLYEMHSGQLHPVRWAKDCRWFDPVKWLAMGFEPSPSYSTPFGNGWEPLCGPGTSNSRPGARRRMDEGGQRRPSTGRSSRRWAPDTV